MAIDSPTVERGQPYRGIQAIKTVLWSLENQRWGSPHRLLDAHVGNLRRWIDEFEQEPEGEEHEQKRDDLVFMCQVVADEALLRLRFMGTTTFFGCEIANTAKGLKERIERKSDW